ncbi:MAG: chromosomal replication initiator protein DnaA, partial [Oscillospiraceae bacterium]|nr:chromosomal replication initiator protein DnaA [Oscillospiraceae bacterium]
MDDIWELTLSHMRKELSETAMQLWFKNIKIVELNENGAVLLCENNFKRDVIEKRHMEKLKNNLSKILGFDINVRIISKEMELSETESEQLIKDDLELIEKDGEPEEVSESSSLLPRQQKSFEYTFENFIVGSSNKFAHAASMAVANNPGYEYNPLFIYGASGLGKTHLLYAISNKIMERNPKTNIILVKGEEFTNQIIESIRLGSTATAQFKNKYRKADVLLIDDIQFIAGKDSTQEEFFHTFNALYEEDKQIILTSDRPPKDIKTLEDRLKTRFEMGLTPDIQPPDYELRIAIMQNKAQHLGLVFPNDVLNFLAENLHSNVRQLEGAIKKIGAQSYLNKVDITLELAINCTADLFSGSEP